MEYEYTSASEIIPGVWIGDRHSAQDINWQRSVGIVSVFNCTKDLPFHPEVPRQFRIPVDDHLQPSDIRSLEEWAPEIAYRILAEYKAGYPILIHCYAGRQRSTASCAFFLMVLTGQPLINVMYMIKSKRSVAFSPSPNFATSMRGFEQYVRNHIHRYS